MRSKGFGDEFINRYRMVNQFFQQKRPLIILICGSTCTGGWGAGRSGAQEGQAPRQISMQVSAGVASEGIQPCAPASCTGKSTFAQQLASRLNLPNVLQTDILYEVRQLLLCAQCSVFKQCSLRIQM